MHANGISVNDERTFALTQRNQSVLLLKPAKQQSKAHTKQSSKGRNHASFEQEDAHYLLIRCTKVAQGGHIGLFIDDKHRERTYNIEARHHQNKGEKDVGDNLFYIHYAERVFLLLIPIEHFIFVTHNVLNLLFHRIGAGIGFKFQL